VKELIIENGGNFFFAQLVSDAAIAEFNFPWQNGANHMIRI